MDLQVSLELHHGQMTPALAAGRRTLGKTPELSAEPSLCSWGCWGPGNSLGILHLQTSRTNLACLPLCSLSYLWALSTCWPNLPTCDGQGTNHRHKIWGEEKTVPLEAVGWTPVLAHIPLGCCYIASCHHTEWVALPHMLLSCHIFFLSKTLRRLVKDVFEFCKNSNVWGFFSESYLVEVSFASSHP